MPKTLIRGCTVLDPATRLYAPMSILIAGKTIEAIHPVIAAERADLVIEADGLVATPGFIGIHVHLHRGVAATTVWTCDLSHDYVSINADYRS